MKKVLLAAAALLIAAEPASAAKKRRAAVVDEPKMESYSSMQMEAMGIMGELKYQHGDFVGANDTFKDSLNDSRNIAAPNTSVVALDLYRTAELAARKGDFRTARERLDILSSRYPDSEFASRGRDLRKLLPEEGRDQDRYAPVTAVVTADQPEFLLGRIQAAVRARDDENALELCREFLRRTPTRPESQEVRLLGAALYLRLGDAEGAERNLTFLTQRASDAEVRARAVHLLGALWFSQGKHDKVLALVPDVDAARSFSTWISRAQLWRAASEEALGRSAAAASRRERIVESGIASPARAHALASLALGHDAAGQGRRAQQRLDEAGAEARRWGMEDLAVAAELSSAHSLFKARRFAEAAGAYSAFVKRHPASAQRGQALYQEGIALRRVGRREQAVTAFAQLTDSMPQSVFAQDGFLQLGQLYTELGAHDKAAATFERMGKTGEKRGRRESLLMTAQLHYNAKRFKQAIPLYRQFLEENPNDKRRSEVEDLLLTSYWHGDRDNPEFMRVAERYPKHSLVAHARWELGARAYRGGDYALAAQWLSRFAADYPKSAHAADSLYYLAEAQLATEEPAEAAKAYRAFLLRFPYDVRGKQARPRLAEALFKSGDFAAAAFVYKGQGRALEAALAYDKAGKPAEALASYEAWLKTHAAHARSNEVRLAVAEAKEKKGDLAGAAAAYEGVMDEAHRIPALFAAGRLREKLKQNAAAARAYQALRSLRPANHLLRLRGLVRLGLLLEVQDKPIAAMGVYVELMKAAPRGGEEWKAAAQRLEALSRDGSLVGKR